MKDTNKIKTQIGKDLIKIHTEIYTLLDCHNKIIQDVMGKETLKKMHDLFILFGDIQTDFNRKTNNRPWIH